MKEVDLMFLINMIMGGNEVGMETLDLMKRTVITSLATFSASS